MTVSSLQQPSRSREARLSFSFEGSRFLLRTFREGQWEIRRFPEPIPRFDQGFYLQPARVAFRAFLEAHSKIGPVLFSFQSGLNSHTFSLKTLKQQEEKFILYTERFRPSFQTLLELLSCPQTFVLTDPYQIRGEEHFFGTVRKLESSFEVLPSSVEWMVFFLFGEGLYARSLVRPGFQSFEWNVFVFSTAPSLKVKSNEFPELTSKITKLLQKTGRAKTSPQPRKKESSEKRISVQLKVSSFCNFDCSFCYYKERLKEPRLINLERVLPALKTFFSSFNKNGVKGTVLLHGGEPLTHPDLLGLKARLEENLGDLLSKETRFLMTTNGLLLGKRKFVFSFVRLVRVSLDPSRFKRQPHLWKGFIFSLKKVFPENHEKIDFVSLIGLDSPKEIVSLYERLQRELGIRFLRAVSERLITESPEENYGNTHKKFLEEILEILERAYLLKIEYHPKFFLPRFYSGKIAHVVHGCGKCYSPNIVDIDGSIRVCLKNYSIPPAFSSPGEFSSFLERMQDRPLLPLMGFLRFGEEKTLRQIVCGLLGCTLSDRCTGGCICFPIVDQSDICASMAREFCS